MGKNKATNKLYYLKNRERILARNKANYERKMSDPEFKEYRKRMFKKHYYENREEHVRKVTAYRKEKRTEINAWVKEYKRINPSYKLSCNLRNRLYAVLKGNIKKSSVIELLGCSVDELKVHLESKFQDGMSWENYTTHGWHVDHIKPCASFDLTDFKQQKQCFHYTNLQPLWAKENHSKSDKLL